MSQNPIVQILIDRDGMTRSEALEMLRDARVEVVRNGADPEEILLNDFCLEPDYLFDLLGGGDE